MAALHVRDVPESVMAGLRERAARRGVSVQEEVRGILAVAAAEPGPYAEPEPLGLTTVRAGSTSTWSRDEMYDDAGR